MVELNSYLYQMSLLVSYPTNLKLEGEWLKANKLGLLINLETINFILFCVLKGKVQIYQLTVTYPV